MGDRVAEYLNFMIMLVAIVAVIGIGATFMYLGRKMGNSFSDTISKTYADSSIGMLRDLSNTDYMEMPAAAALSLLYDYQDVIYDVYDCRDVSEKVYNLNTGKLNSTKHLNTSGKSTKNVIEARDKFAEATSYFTVNLNKKIKVSAVVNNEHIDYYDIYLHDIDCINDNEYHTGACKHCNKGTNHTGECTYN